MAGDHCLNLTLIDLEDEDYPFLELGSNVVKVGGAAENIFSPAGSAEPGVSTFCLSEASPWNPGISSSLT